MYMMLLREGWRGLEGTRDAKVEGEDWGWKEGFTKDGVSREMGEGWNRV